MNKREFNILVRDELEKAGIVEAEKRPFNLRGRGHEPRVSLGKQLAAVLRNANIPRTVITGYGPNNYYPKRIFDRATRRLKRRFGQEIIGIYNDWTYLKINDVSQL